MSQPLLDFFKSDEFMPHGHCFLWKPEILWLHVASDTAIAGAYYAIPLALLYFVRNRKDLPYKTLFLLFSAFIWLCGTTHLMGMWVIWHPDYATDGVIKAVTAVVSIIACVVTIRLIPLALHLVSPAEIARRSLAAQLQRSEAMLSAVVAHTHDGVLTINAEGIVETFNPACERIFGYSAAEVLGKDVGRLVPEMHPARHGSAFPADASRELSAACKDGSTRPIDLSVSSFRLGDRQYFSGIIRDITDRKEAEAQVIQYTQALERSNLELDEFAHIASHDLKEPLRGVQTQAAILKEDYAGKLDEKGVERIGRITFLLQRMEQLITNLLYYSELGISQLAVQETDLNVLIDEIRQMLDPYLKKKQAGIFVQDTLPVVSCDKIRVAEVFRNLITNAIKYNDKPEKIVEVGYRKGMDAPHGRAKDVFYVRDNGIGIAPEHHGDVFRIFRRLPNALNEEGSGAGLTFVKKILERTGGKIWLDSRPGEGTTFYFTLK
ncbi:MAG: PAS domain S-box protein [Alphaproteobacteria bacterium]